MIIKGNDIIVYSGGDALAASKSCTINLKAETMEVSSPTQGKYREYIPSYMTWSLSTSHLVVTNNKTDTPIKDFVLHVGETYNIKVGRRDDTGDAMEGEAICTESKITATRGNLATGSFSFKGTGEFAAPVASSESSEDTTTETTTES